MKILTPTSKEKCSSVARKRLGVFNDFAADALESDV